MARRTPLTKAEKESIEQKKVAGASFRQIASQLQCSLETIRKWWRILRSQRTVHPRGRPKRGILSTYPEAIRLAALKLKKEHPHWGPASIKLELQRDSAFSDLPLPSDARLSALFQEACPEAIQPRQRQLPKPQKRSEVRFPHQRWQVDGKEGIPIGADFVTILEIRELYCGLMIGAQAFVTSTARHWRHLTLAEVQSTLRQAFEIWGLPLEIQTDHENVFWNTNDPLFPSLFTLWLIGLGIRHLPSRPHRPTDQGAVERNHRTLGDFAWKDGQFSQVDELQKALDLHRQRYNQDFPSEAAHCHQQAPLRAFPSAVSTGRPFHPALEWQFFSLPRVDAYLAQFVWTRLITSNGMVYLGQKRYQLGRVRKGQKVSVQFIPEGRYFRFKDAAGEVLAEIPIQGLEKEDILSFVPASLALPVGYQLPLPLVGV